MKMATDSKTVSIRELVYASISSRTIPIMLKSKNDNITEIKQLFEQSDFLFAYIDFATINESIELIVKISMFIHLPDKKKVVFFFDNFEKADHLSVMYLFSSILGGNENRTFHEETDVLLFNTYSSCKNIPIPILNRSIHLSLD